ncbi:MAG: GntR family transcriptional regulator [Bacteroidaceae bacterium]|jgi:DNA-binding transcriptional regulator YhcF (GntR family)|nr:GntR family transcriptional regulator [Bacteroidaceae bacterium]
MEFKENKAIYLQIVDRLCDDILLGKYQEEDRIPSVREYSASVEVNVNTAVRSYDHLQNQGIIFTKRGLGYFVSPGAKSVIEEMRREEFLNEKLPELLQSMKTLNISIDELVCKLKKISSNNKEQTI